MNFTYAETDAVAKLVPPTPHMTLADALKQSAAAAADVRL